MENVIYIYIYIFFFFIYASILKCIKCLNFHVLQRNTDLPWVAAHRSGDTMNAGTSMDAGMRRYVQTNIAPTYQYDHVMTIVGYVYL